VKRIEDYMISFSGPKTMAVRVNTPVAAAAQPLATLRITGIVGGAVGEFDSDGVDRTAEKKGGWRGVRVGTTAAKIRQMQQVAVVEAAARVIQQKMVLKYLAYGCIAWAYVGIMGNGIGITAAREVERAQLSLAERSDQILLVDQP
jgi:hypothetical protein